MDFVFLLGLAEGAEREHGIAVWLVLGIEPVQLLTAYRYTIFLPFYALIALKVGISRVEIVPPFWLSHLSGRSVFL